MRKLFWNMSLQTVLLCPETYKLSREVPITRKISHTVVTVWVINNPNGVRIYLQQNTPNTPTPTRQIGRAECDKYF